MIKFFLALILIVGSLYSVKAQTNTEVKEQKNRAAEGFHLADLGNGKYEIQDIKSDVKSYRLINSFGQVHGIGRLNGTKSVDFTVNNLPAGTYYIELNTGEEVFRKRLDNM